MFILDITYKLCVMVVSELVDKRNLLRMVVWPKPLKDDRLKHVNIINHTGPCYSTSYVITTVTEQNEKN
jgi:hypothetical protein